MTPRLSIVGLTGGIASGKSTVAKLFREQGLPVIDADGLGRFVLEKGNEAFEPALAAFGSDILDDSGEIDRQRLGAKVFNNKEARARLEAITHPAIANLTKQAMEMIAKRGVALAIYEAALLVETGIYKSLAGLIVVFCPVETQLERLIARDGLSREDAALRIASQLPVEDKLKVADYVIDTAGGMEETRARSLDVIAAMQARFQESAKKGE